MIIYPRAFEKFFSVEQLPMPDNTSGHSYYWDVEHYAAMTIDTSCNAFYPLWPWLIKTLFQPKTVISAAFYLKAVGAGIFLAILPPLYILFERIFKSSKIAFLVMLAFTLNPTGIMRVLGYTESIYCLTSILTIWSLSEFQSKVTEARYYLIPAFSIIIISLTRPSSIQIIAAAIAASITLIVIRFRNSDRSSWKEVVQEFIPELKMSAVLVISTLIGYAIYGWICWQVKGDFFAPFHEQANWGRKIGFHPDLLFVRASMFEMMALYLPFIILVSALAFAMMKDRFQAILNAIPQSPLGNVWLLYPPLFVVGTIFRLKLKSKQIRKEWQALRSIAGKSDGDLETSYLFWFSTYFAVVTSALVFLCPVDFGLPSLGSLDRQVFAIPFIYISLGCICAYLQNNRVNRSIYFLIAISIIATIEKWIDYGKDLWLS